MAQNAGTASERGAYVGWYAAAIVLLLVAVGATIVWFTFHPW